MDIFIADALDLLPEESLPAGIVDAGDGSLDVTALLRSERLRDNLSFGNAWRAAFGVLPPRQAYWDFVRKQKNLGAVFISCSPLKLSSAAQTTLKSAVDAYASMQDALLADDLEGSRARDMLRLKFADRFGSPPLPRSSAGGIVGDYAASILHPDSIRLLTLMTSDDATVLNATKSPGDYYMSSCAIVNKMRLDCVDPLSGDVVFQRADNDNEPKQKSTHTRNAATVVEHLRHIVFCDSCLWRRAATGCLLVIGPTAATGYTQSNHCTHSTFVRGTFTVTTCIPWPVVRAALGPVLGLSLFKRVVIESSEPITTLSQANVFPLYRISSESSSNASSPTYTNSAVLLGDMPVDIERLGKMFTEIYVKSTFLPTPLFWAAKPAWSSKLYDHMVAENDDNSRRFQSFVASYAAVRKLDSRHFTVSSAAEKPAKNTILLIDTRENVMSVMALLVTLDNLELTIRGNWAVTVVCSRRNEAFMRSMIGPQVLGARFVVLDESEMTVEGYSELMKSTFCWSLIESEMTLTVQDDGMLVRPGLESDSEIMSADYVGAPWADAQSNAEVRQWTRGGLVGNGGLSLRRTSEMLRVSTECVDEARVLFNSKLQPVPEDVFFAGLCKRPASAEVAARLAMEQRISKKPLGFHKPWPYHPQDVVEELYKDAILDALARPTV